MLGGFAIEVVPMGFLRRLPVLFFVAGLAVKGLLVLAWKFSKAPELSNLLTTYDPGAFALAEKGVGLLFDTRRLAPTPGEALAFDLLLVLGFGLECMVVGFFWELFMRPKRADPVAWARAETVAFSKRKAKKYGLLALMNLVVFALTLKTMPLHAFWPFLGPPLGISLVCLTTVAGFYAIALLGEWKTGS